MYWRAVSLSLHAPWFLLTFLVGDGDESLKHTVCVASDVDLVAMIESAPSLKPCGVVYMQPGWASLTGDWMSRHVASIWRVRDAYDAEAFMFLDDAGNEYSGSGERLRTSGDRQLVLRLAPGRSSTAWDEHANPATTQHIDA